ncbi:MAG TPA: hypothetical protein VFQ53_27895 [Kofleriaceae bacterium]|nr:hypothetical protein [Kofleriaceae bacterium]
MLVALLVAACGKTAREQPANATDEVTTAPPVDDKFSGTLSGHAFEIAIADGKLETARRDTWTWRAGSGKVTLSDSGPVTPETHFLVERSPRTIVRDSDGLWVVTEVVRTAGGRVFTCLYRQAIESESTLELNLAKQRGVAACGSLVLDPSGPATR